MTISESIKAGLEKSISFSSRATRVEFWMTILVCLCASLVVGFLKHKLSITDYPSRNETKDTLLPAFASTLMTIVWLPGLAVSVRRIHDLGRSGWLFGIWASCVLCALLLTNAMFMRYGVCAREINYCPTTMELFLIAPPILFLGLCLFLIVTMSRRSQPGPNKYGPNLHEVTP